MPPKKFVAALRKPLLEKRIASHKKILQPRNIRVFHEKYVYKKNREKYSCFEGASYVRSFSFLLNSPGIVPSREILNNRGKLFRTIVLMCERIKFVSLRSETIK